ncbi:MAG: hypothetical protein ABSA90_11735 [Xanthobacteraceae bacterium]|jgi:hypothetical protein
MEASISSAQRLVGFTADFTFRFRLPPALALCVPPGRWIGPCIHQARVDVGEDATVEIRAFNGSELEARRIVFEQTRRFLIAIAGGARRLPRDNFSGRLVKASRPDRYEHYEIVTGAALSITQAIMAPAVLA